MPREVTQAVGEEEAEHFIVAAAMTIADF
jgi:hypothetical protein